MKSLAMGFYKNFISKNSRSIIILVLLLIDFWTLILGLFLENVNRDLKYKRQMQSPVNLRVEAYFFLDLAL
jgi:hypothetical protein